MEIYGVERKFLMTVGASAEISEFCPDGDLDRLGELFEQSYGKSTRATAKIIASLSRGYESFMKFQNPEYVQSPLTVEQIMSLEPKTYKLLVTEAMKAFTDSVETSVETEPSKKNKEVE
ncbi:MAG: hypothetical protein MJY95_08425 [Bacteroidaceae bacterium]|nr:hypothetical protein [Bacteroidaceae bacterium]